jgi:hypothetical protein
MSESFFGAGRDGDGGVCVVVNNLNCKINQQFLKLPEFTLVMRDFPIDLPTNDHPASVPYGCNML